MCGVWAVLWSLVAGIDLKTFSENDQVLQDPKDDDAV
jgi:hypothetical protein